MHTRHIEEQTQAIARVGSLARLPGRTLERLLLGLAGVSVLVGVVTLSLAGLPHWSPAHWGLLVAWAFCFGAAHVLLERYLPRRDPFLLPLSAFLSGWGLLLIARLSALSFLVRQCIWLVLGVAVLWAVASRPPGLRWLRRYRYTWLLGGLALLAATLLWGRNPTGYGPRLWLGGRFPLLGGLYIQPSELLKLLMVAFLASYLAEKRELVVDGPRWGLVRLPSLAYMAPLLVMWGLAMVLLAWQQDLGAALLFFFTFLAMLYQASGAWGYVAGGVALFLVAALGSYALLDTVTLRVDIWLNPWADPAGRAFQVVQALIAFASGGLFGQGLGQGHPTYVPAIHTDFPFAAIAEEFGLIGVVALIAAIAMLALRGMRIALQARTPFQQLLAAGLSTFLGLQAWVIMAGSVRLIPLTGVTLPFVSYGGSSLFSSFAALGLLLVVSHETQSVGPAPLAAGSMAGPMRRVGFALLVAFGGLALMSGYWGLVRQEALRTRDDNPRLVLAEQRVRRGPIFDRRGTLLARSEAGPDGVQKRILASAPVVGYYSLKHGVGGIEAAYDTLLRGLEGRSAWARFWDALLHRQPPGRGVTLSLDASLQVRVADVMGTRPGAVVLMDVHTGEVLALVSQPAFDPNTLDQEWDRLAEDPAAPLLNRVTQGLYQPGGALQLVVLATALQEGQVALEGAAGDLGPVVVDGRSLGCGYAPAGSTVADAVRAACPAPMAALGQALGGDSLTAAWRRWGLGDPPPLEIPTESGEAQVHDPRLAGVGQDALTVTPLQMALVVATLGNEGVRPAPRLVLRTQGPDGRWVATEPVGQPVEVVTSELAYTLRSVMRPAAGGRVIGHGSVALAGADAPPHAWYIGLAPAQAPRYAVAVLLEQGGATGPSGAEEVGSAVLVAALDAPP